MRDKLPVEVKTLCQKLIEAAPDALIFVDCSGGDLLVEP
jgi:hypothetical protein